jgi:hypothetical protein
MHIQNKRAAGGHLEFVGNEIWNAECETFVNVQVSKKLEVDCMNGLEIMSRTSNPRWL